MKKVFSLLLAVLMLVSALPVAYAADVDYTVGTAVVYTAANNEDYSITVPASLAPGSSGTVTLEGTWAPNTTISVTADTSVKLTNSINANDTKTLDVSFAGISEAGSNTSSQKFTAPVSVDPIENAIFGTWDGHFYYYVGTETEEIEETEVVEYAFTASDYDSKMGTTTITDADVVIPEIFTYDGTTYKVTSLGDYAFYGASLTSIDIPDSVTSISEGAFQYCTNLASIDIPDSVTTVGERAFDNCTNLTSIDIPDSVTTIGNFAFAFCEKLTSVTIPNSITSISEGAFSYCPNLTSIDIPDGVTSIGIGAFSNCTKLTSIDIPDSVTTIDNSAFEFCEELTSVTIPNSVTSIGDYAFSYCKKLTTVNFTGTVAQWNSMQFGGSDWNKKVPATEVICSDGTVALS